MNNTPKRHSDASSFESKDVYKEVTDRIIASLEKGVIPWRKPWGTVRVERPVNIVSGKRYRGINFWLLGLSDFTDHRFVSFKQAQDLGGSVRKGERGSLIVFYSEVLVKEKDSEGNYTGSKVPVRLLKHSYVWNVEQCDGLKVPEIERPEVRNRIDTIESAEEIYDKYPLRPSLAYGGNSAFYKPSSDHVQMPHRDQFKDAESFYATLFHELAHSTGHEKRLNRKDIQESQGFGSVPYCKEELTAELGSSYLMAEVGLSNDEILDNATAYLNSWLQALKNDKRLIVKASGLASSACDWILGRSAQGVEA